MSIEEERKDEEHHGHNEDVEDLKEVLTVVSQTVPNIIKSIIGSIFSEQAGADMGKAVGAFYKGLKDAGIPEETAVKMTEGYISTFTSIGDVMKQAVGKSTGERKEEKSKETEEKR